MIEALRQHILTLPDVQKYLLFERDGEAGLICCDEDTEESDAHCEVCREEILAFRLRGPNEELPFFYFVGVGPTKFARIQQGWRDSQGFDLNNVRFVDG